MHYFSSLYDIYKQNITEFIIIFLTFFCLFLFFLSFETNLYKIITSLHAHLHVYVTLFLSHLLKMLFHNYYSCNVNVTFHFCFYSNSYLYSSKVLHTLLTSIHIIVNVCITISVNISTPNYEPFCYKCILNLIISIIRSYLSQIHYCIHLKKFHV